MHELGITRHLVSIVTDKAAGAKITRVTVEIGAWTAVCPDAIRFCFDAVAQGTVAEGAELEIIEVPGLGHCTSCGRSLNLPSPYDPCPCGSLAVTPVSGHELTVKHMVIA